MHMLVTAGHAAVRIAERAVIRYNTAHGIWTSCTFHVSLGKSKNYYGTLEQNRMGDVAAIRAHKNKRANSESSS